MRLKITVDGKEFDVDVQVEEEPRPTLGSLFMAPVSGGTAAAPSEPAAASSVDDEHAVKAPLSGAVARIEVDPGDEISAGQVLLVLEAMKMETEITAPSDGAVAAILVEVGDSVSGGQVLVELESGFGLA